MPTHEGRMFHHPGHLTWWNESDTQTSWQKEKQWDPQIYTSNCSQTSAKNQTTEVITVITLESCSTWFHVELLWNSCAGGTSSSFLDLSCNNWWMRACISETSNLRAVQTLRLVVNLEKYIDTLASLILQTSQDMKLSNGWANTPVMMKDMYSCVLANFMWLTPRHAQYIDIFSSMYSGICSDKFHFSEHRIREEKAQNLEALWYFVSELVGPCWS